MKKLLPYIFIFTIAINLFAPFAIHFGQKGFEVSKNEARATQINKFTVSQTSNTSDTITLEVYIEIEPPTFALSGYEVNGELTLKELDGSRVLEFHTLDLVKNGGVLINTKDTNGNEIFKGKVVFNKLSPATKYQLHSSLKYIVHASDLLSLKDEYDANPSPNPIIVNTFDTADPNSGTSDYFQKQSGGAGVSLPSCHVLNGYGPGEGTIWGCLIQLEYWGLFQPTSWLFAWSGKFFDWAFGYSVQDSSYRSSFIVNGWSIVRDVCNLFFIFILIYAAFGLILGLHSINSKKIIISVILIGLLINFSLFAGQLIVDTSNILARMFYNPNLIEIINKSSGTEAKRAGLALNQNTVLGEISLSAAIVDKVDPQQLILNSTKIGLENSGTYSKGTENDASLSEGQWFLVITLATIVNVIGIFVFISAGLVFIARVIGLWFALVLAPFAFFSYTVPQLQGISMLGWKKWWPDLLGLCFVAPLFMFFMYLIIMFLEKGFAGLPLDDTGSNWALAVIVPFIFIMMMLLMAKKLAKDYSGEMGKMIVNGVTAVGAMALGGAALTTAFAGRTLIGRPLKKIANSDAATKHTQDLKKWEEGGQTGPKPKAGFLASWGAAMNRREEKQDHIIHTRHELDEIAKKEFNGQSYGELGGLQKQQIRETLIKEKAEKKYNSFARKSIAEGGYDKDYKDLNDDEKKDIRTKAENNTRHHVEESADQKIGLSSVLQTSMRKGSYDARNLSALGTNSMDSIFNKLGTKLMVGIGMGMRMGFKSSGINHGTGQKDFFKDIGNTIKEALKDVKLNVDLKGGGGGGDHGSGHDDHGHGGGGGGHH